MSETTLTECPNCHTKLKSSLFGFVVLLDDNKVRLINAVNNTDLPGYCNKCGDSQYEQAVNKVDQETKKAKQELINNLKTIPVISVQNPLNWDYQVIRMVTGQSVTGTGAFSEFTSSWTDLFGAQSGAYNTKLREGEGLCFAQLRKQTLELGGNAVIATDIDYSEVGGDKGMLMVCMAGTAVKLKNPHILGEDFPVKFEELLRLDARIKELTRLKKNE